MKNIKLFLISILLSLPMFAYAELEAVIKMSPENPSPYETVNLTLQSYSFNVNTAKITWYVEGKLVVYGIGEKNISIKTHGVGEIIPVIAKAETTDGSILELKLQITPQDVDIVWESLEGYTPPFYEGKTLPGEGSVVKVTAIPSFSEEGKQIPPSNLSYAWYLNDEYIDSASGYGKQSTNLQLDYLSEKTNITVRVQSTDGSVAEKSISIYPHEVMPLFYLYDDVLGNDFSQLLDKRLETSHDTNISLSPFYLSTKWNLDTRTSYDWFLNGAPIIPQENLSVLLRPQEDSYGSKILSVTVSNSKRILQKAEATLEVIFDTRN